MGNHNHTVSFASVISVNESFVQGGPKRSEINATPKTSNFNDIIH